MADIVPLIPKPERGGAIPVKNGFRQEPVKKTVNERLREQIDTRDEAIGVALKNAAAGLGNEAITRKRFDGFVGLPFTARVKWVLTGRLPATVQTPVEPVPEKVANG